MQGTGLECPRWQWVWLSAMGLGSVVLPLLHALTPLLDRWNYTTAPAFAWLGAVLYAAAVALILRAYGDLGQWWSPLIESQEGQKLVTQGAYAWVRHPVYAGLLLWAAAQPLLFHNWIAGWGMLVAAIPFYLHRRRCEEQLLLERFGDEYRAYMARTGALWPRLRR